MCYPQFGHPPQSHLHFGFGPFGPWGFLYGHSIDLRGLFGIALQPEPRRNDETISGRSAIAGNGWVAGGCGDS